MHEHIAAAFALDKTVALGVVEPLDLACNTHRSLPVLLVARRHRTDPPLAHRWMSWGQQKKAATCGLLVRRNWTAGMILGRYIWCQFRKSDPKVVFSCLFRLDEDLP